MSFEEFDILSQMHPLIDQTSLILDLYKRGLISQQAYKTWLEGQWAVIWELHGKLKEVEL